MEPEMIKSLSDAVLTRGSTRTFSSSPLDQDTLKILSEYSPEVLGSCPVACRIVHSPGKLDPVFRGVIGGYGKITGAAAMVVLTSPQAGYDACSMEAGYVGEQYVLLATALGLGSCWNGGMFSFKRLMGLLAIAPQERVHAIIALGEAVPAPDGLGKLTKAFTRRKTMDEIAAPDLLKELPYAEAALSAVCRAPSALNRQPWSFQLEDSHAVISSASTGALAAMDLGIAMYHFRLGAQAAGFDGRWELRASNRARFVVSR